METGKTPTGKTGPFRKRSVAMHKKQQLKDFWDSDTLLPQSIDADLIKHAELSEFYEDAGENYEKVEGFTPFSRLPYSIKEKFEEEFEKMDKNLIERKRRDNSLIRDNSFIEKNPTIPLRLDGKHRHDCIKFPMNGWDELSKQNDKNIYGKYEIGGSFILIFFSSPECTFLIKTDRAMHSLMKIDKYDGFENFILPRIYQHRGRGYKTTIGKFIDELYSSNRFECTSIELKNVSNGKEQKRSNVLITMKLDDRDLFYVTSIFKCISNWVISNDITKGKLFAWEQDDSITKKERKNIREYDVQFTSYFYFTCGCEK